MIEDHLQLLNIHLDKFEKKTHSGVLVILVSSPPIVQNS